MLSPLKIQICLKRLDKKGNYKELAKYLFKVVIKFIKQSKFFLRTFDEDSKIIVNINLCKKFKFDLKDF